ncbi:DUF6701 domain-containing protein [Vibrio parahaemolyticus]|uniref:DUF6701 domain-containing protein n=1 Tax=Vibrio parahaemolyticus TaxID=670 RepID=UPI00111D63E7|nr:DUF6701 domain-containing protein [Vibrio parahaemolyticus]TOF60580.1 polymer-forming cytoskeletal family protein [Vibrio parahaemolyticus]
MMRLYCVIATAMLMPLTAQATVYDVAKPSELNQICSTHSSFDIQRTNTTFFCHGKIVLPAGDSIISSSPENEVILEAHQGIVLEGNNRIGEPNKRISLRSLSVELKVNNEQASSIEDYQNKHTVIYGDLLSAYPTNLHNVLIDGDIELTGSTLHIDGKYNTIIGKILTHSTTDIFNANVCGTIESKGHQLHLKTNHPFQQHFVVGDIVAHSTLLIDDMAVYGTTESKGASAALNGSFYAKDTAIKYFQTLNFNQGVGSQVCGEIQQTPGSSHPHSVTGKYSQFCGVGQSRCDYSSSICPSTATPPPECSMLPPSNDDLGLTVTPSDDMALMCGDDLPQFTAITTNNDEVVSAPVMAMLSDPDLFTLEVVKGKPTSTENQFQSNDNGELIVRVVPNDINKIALDANYYLTFTMVGDSAKEQTVNFMFTPFMFEAYSNERRTLNEIRVIAGKPENVHTRLLACASTGEPVVASNYNGKPKVVHPLIKPLGGSEGEFSYSAEFKDGLSEHGLITNESGLFEVTLSDQFECKGFSECPDDGTVEVTGKFNVYSRPWTLAICENQNTLPSGTSEQGDKFIAAGEHFSLTVKPVIWQKGGSISDPIDSSAYCDALVTTNFMHDGAPAASVVLSSEQHSPLDTANQTSTLLKSNYALTQGHQSAKNHRFVFNGLYWEEVGSLKVKANLGSTYFGMKVNEGYRHIGRFYPKYFKVQSQDWTYPKNQGFVYMNQPFEKVTYDVVALNANKEDVKNYAHFAPSLQQHFYLGELGGYQDRFVPPAPQKAEWKRIGDASIGQFVIEKASTNATCHNSPCWEKDITKGQYPDGPFNRGANSKDSKIGLVTTHVVDEVNFFDGGEILTKQPDIRFGRLNFKDVGGNQGMKIKVPLDVEMWQDGRFVTNFDDNSTTANGAYYTSTPIWSNAPVNNAQLSGVAKMSVGRTNDIIASQIDAAREQIQFSLNLDHSGNQLPWLKYDWETSTPEEENPPTIVTFGIHRGNDRIIYRGEPNMLGLN